ncbi:MarR family winged helix-turn-helix transcriptional regulator [Secundilactobacillus paracollinoides]|nr:MarR family transcriptional regulator [Secundilactobacillus paracollinoides]
MNKTKNGQKEVQLMTKETLNTKTFGQLFTIYTQAFLQNRSIDDLGMTRLQAMALRNVFENSGMTMTQLAQVIGISSSQLTRLVATLEERGLVARKRNPENRRVVNVYRTEKGAALVKGHLDLTENRLAGYLTRLDAADQEKLIAYMRGSIELMVKAGIIDPEIVTRLEK